MKGEIAQIVALTCHGNAFLRGLAVPQFFPSNSTCKYCGYVKFIQLKSGLFGKVKEVVVAESPDLWFEYLKRLDATGLRLSNSPQNSDFISDRMSSAFAGGGSLWTINVFLPNCETNHWCSRWRVGDQNAPEKRIWQVDFGMIGVGKNPGTCLSLTEARTELLSALSEIKNFSEKNDCGGFTQCFVRAVETLTSTAPVSGLFHNDLAPAGFLSADAKAILDASQQAWVFGGMGSWNDLGFSGEEGKLYERVSERLFHALNRAIEAAANDSFPLE